MGFLGSFFGSDGGAGFNATGVPIDQGYDLGQVTNSYNRSKDALARQQNLIDRLQAFNAADNQQTVYDQGQGLQNQLQQIARGTGGPNPAMAQLANTTGQNIASQAALMAGQRGAGANAGLLARQIGMQGANIQQNAVGQGAALEAQQRMNALGQIQQQQGLLGNIAGQQVGQTQNAIGLYNQAAQSEQQNLLNALAQYNNANVSQQSGINAANAHIQGQVAGGQAGLFGMGAAAAGSALGLFAGGGMVPNQNYAAGGSVDLSAPQSYVTPHFELFGSAPRNGIGSPQTSSVESGSPVDNSAAIKTAGALGKVLGSQFSQTPTPTQSAGMKAGGNLGMVSSAPFGGGFGNGFGAGAMAGLSSGYAQGGSVMLNGEMLAARGKMVPGKAAVQGNSLKNDVVPAMLSPKEIVIPRSITMAPNAPDKARDFVAAVLAKNGMGMKKK